MAGPLSGIGQGQTFIPNNAPSQAVQNNSTQVRQQRDERQAEENRVQPQPTQEASATQNVETNNQETLRAQRNDDLSAQSNRDPLDPNRARGSIVDITI